MPHINSAFTIYVYWRRLSFEFTFDAEAGLRSVRWKFKWKMIMLWHSLYGFDTKCDTRKITSRLYSWQTRCAMSSSIKQFFRTNRHCCSRPIETNFADKISFDCLAKVQESAKSSLMNEFFNLAQFAPLQVQSLVITRISSAGDANKTAL